MDINYVVTGQFQCSNGTTREGAYCVPLSAKCDSVNDCSDGSDELGCIQDGCPGNFQVYINKPLLLIISLTRHDKYAHRYNKIKTKHFSLSLYIVCRFCRS